MAGGAGSISCTFHQHPYSLVLRHRPNMSTFDPADIRHHFPALAEKDARGQPLIFFDGPGGTQVTQGVIAAMTAYLSRANANTHARHVGGSSCGPGRLSQRAIS